jgi:hypothetical protein
MRQPGRKSAASKVVRLAATGTRTRPTAPSGLTKPEASLFNEIALANRHLTVTDAPILVSFVQASLQARRLGRSNREADIELWDRVTRLQLALARSLRLTVSSTTHPDKLGRVRQDAQPDLVAQYFLDNPDPDDPDDDGDADTDS